MIEEYRDVVIEYLQKLKERAPDLRVVVRDRIFTIDELMEEVRNLTSYGKTYIAMVISQLQYYVQ